MNIIVCGFKGTGKTTLSKMLASELNLKYINDYEICKNEAVQEDLITDFLNVSDNFVVDLCHSFTPKACSKYHNAIAVYLGFATIDEELLYKKMIAHGENITLDQIAELKTQSLTMFSECQKYNIPFFDINQTREAVLKSAFEYIKTHFTI